MPEPATKPDKSASFIVDEQGNRTAVILSIKEYQEMLEDLEDLAAIAERRDEETLPHDEVVASLRQDGLL